MIAFLPSYGFRSLVNGRPNAWVSAAPADIADVLIDIVVGGLGNLLQERRRCHQHARLTVTALRNVHGDPEALQRMAGVRAQSLDRPNPGSNGRFQRELAGPHSSIVDMHSAGTALGDTTTEFSSGHAEMIAQYPEQRRRWIGIDRNRLIVYREGQCHACSCLNNTEFSSHFYAGDAKASPSRSISEVMKLGLLRLSK